MLSLVTNFGYYNVSRDDVGTSGLSHKWTQVFLEVRLQTGGASLSLAP